MRQISRDMHGQSLARPGSHVARQLAGDPLFGHATYAYLAHDAAEEGITCQLPGEVRPRAGEALTVHVPADLAHLFDADGEAFRRIG